jgi:ADP-heptose:LPS heptosyltransferase
LHKKLILPSGMKGVHPMKNKKYENPWLKPSMPFLRKIRKGIKAATLEYKAMRTILKRSAREGKVYCAVQARGGIGDMVRLNAVLCALGAKYPDMLFDIYCGNKNKAAFAFAGLKNKEFVVWEHLFLVTRKTYHLAVSALQICETEFLKPFPRSAQMRRNIESKRHFFSSYLERGEDGYKEMSDAAAAQGLKFNDILFLSIGLSPSEAIKPQLCPLPANPLAGVRYITIHHGWDEDHKIKSGLHTKCWPASKWAGFVEEFKEVFKDIKTVQLGTKKCVAVGADIDLRGKTTLEEACAVLKGAMLHFDCDCGLVHIGNALDVRSVVLFGPTNAAYLGYKENINITAPACANCWHITGDWAERCPKGLKSPACMLSIAPETLVAVCRGLIC